MITLDTLKDSVYALHLTTEQDEQVMDMIETAYRLGWENGYDEAGRNYQPINETLKMTDFQPKPQTNEEVADGLRDAFRQAIKDGVMDATPYLKQMTYKSDIEKTEAEIKVLQKKLELLKEIETHKSQPRMYFELGGKFEIVSYNGENYYRLEYPTDVIWYKKKKPADGMMLVRITDGETRRLLEGLWFNDVKRGNYD